jgi:GxxExxY protein
MPIKLAFEIRRFDQEEFHALDRKLMGIVFDVHNQFGRFLDEALYQREIAIRWQASGFGTAHCEAAIAVTHQSFRKDYYIDVLLNGGLVLETKTAESLTAAHRAQGLNYLFLTGLQHGRLVNLRPPQVKHEFLSTQLTPAKRHRFAIVDSAWRPVSPVSVWLREKIVELLDDWGAFLEVALYRDAITHFLGGPTSVLRPVPIRSQGSLLGTQSMHVLDDDVAFSFTAVTTGRKSMADHQRRFLKHTPMRNLLWINFNRHQIEFTTLP